MRSVYSKKIAIIGGGLAGTACAYVLKQRGFSPVIYETGNALASGASGNDTGLYNPRFTADLSPEGVFYSRAFFHAITVFEALESRMGTKIDWNPCGALHLINDDKKEIRFHKMVQNWGWDAQDMHMVSAVEASDIAQISLKYDALYLPRSGYISPKNLCHAYAQDIPVRYHTTIENLSDVTEDIVILANGAAVKSYAETAHLPLGHVRGQVTKTATTPVLKPLKTALCYGGYCTPVHNGAHMMGASFQRWLSHTDILPQDDMDNITKLSAVLDTAGFVFPEITGHRAALRCTAPDYFPVVGQLQDNLYISTAHGSHGIVSSLMGALVLADIIEEKATLCLPVHIIEKLSPARFSSVL